MTMVKTSVTIPREDLEEAQRRGLNVSAIARQALRDQLNELTDDEAVAGYDAAYTEWGDNETVWDQVAGDGIDADAFYQQPQNQ